MSNEQAGALLGLSVRQVQRLKRGYNERGTDAFKHGSTGKRPGNVISGEERERIVRQCEQKYAGANFAHFTELLAEHEGISTGLLA